MLLLAAAIWLTYGAIESWIMGRVALMPWVWSASGFGVMLVMKAALDRAPPHWFARSVWYLAAPMAAAVIQALIDVTLSNRLGAWLLTDIPRPPPGFVLDPQKLASQLVFKINLRTYFWLYSFYSVTLALMAATEAAFRAREKLLLAELGAQKAEIEALRLHVNPHFLFNAMNSIAALIEFGRIPEAEKLTLALAQYYRSNLTDVDQVYTTLGEELDAMQVYVDLQRHRISNLALEIDVPGDLLNTSVPARLLQPLIDNAVKYGAVGAPSAAIVRLSATAEGATVALRLFNTLSPDPDLAGAGTGLENTRRRLAVLFGDAAHFESRRAADGWVVAVRFPLRRNSTAGNDEQVRLAHG